MEDASTWSEEALRARLEDAAHQPFELARGPLMRVTLYSRGPGEHVLLLVLHHLITDFWSLAVMVWELGTLYAAEQRGTSVTLPPLPLCPSTTRCSSPSSGPPSTTSRGAGWACRSPRGGTRTTSSSRPSATRAARRSCWRASSSCGTCGAEGRCAAATGRGKWLAGELRREFEPSRAPLLRLTLLRLGERTWRFVFGCSHLLIDGWSMPLVVRELFTRYEALRRGRALPSPEAPPFRDFVSWLARRGGDTSREFWGRMFAGYAWPATARHEAKAGPTPDYRESSCQLPERLSASLQEFARRHQPVRVRVPGSEPNLEWLRALQTRLSELRQHEASSLEEIRGACGLPARGALFDSLVVFENYPVEAAPGGGPGGLEFRDIRVHETSGVPLVVVGVPGRELRLHGLYDVNRFSAAEVEGMFGALRRWLEALTKASAR